MDDIMEDFPEEPHNDGDHQDLGDEKAHARLLDAISAIHGDKRLKHSLRTVPGKAVTEFGLNPGKVDTRTLMTSMMGSLAKSTSYTDTKKQLKAVFKGAGPVETPAPKHIKEKAQRAVSYEKTVTELSKWDPVVTTNRKAHQLKFPLEQSSQKMINMHMEFRPVTDLDKALAAELAQVKPEDRLPKGKLFTPAQEQQMAAMTLEEAKERRAEIIMRRALWYNKNSKLRWQNSIKSKRYRRAKKLEKQKQTAKELEELAVTDPQALADRMEQVERKRLEERGRLRHMGGGKFARQAKIFSKYDDEKRQQIQDMLAKHRELKQKQKPLPLPSSSESEGEETEGPSHHSNNTWMQPSASSVPSSVAGPAPPSAQCGEEGGGEGEENEEDWLSSLKIKRKPRNADVGETLSQEQEETGEEDDDEEEEEEEEEERGDRQEPSLQDVALSEAFDTEISTEEIHSKKKDRKQKKKQKKDLSADAVSSAKDKVPEETMTVEGTAKDIKKKKKLQEESSADAVPSAKKKKTLASHVSEDSSVKDKKKKKKKKLQAESSADVVPSTKEKKTLASDVSEDSSLKDKKKNKKKKLQVESSADVEQSTDEKKTLASDVSEDSPAKAERSKTKKLKRDSSGDVASISENKSSVDVNMDASEKPGKSKARMRRERRKSQQQLEKLKETDDVKKIKMSKAAVEGENSSAGEDNFSETEAGEMLDQDRSELPSDSEQPLSAQGQALMSVVEGLQESERANQKAPPAVARDNTITIAEAFEDDDVVAEFAAEKQRVMDEEQEKDTDLFMPGWGSWGGPGILPSQKLRKRFIKKAPVQMRADNHIGHVIISEKANKAVEKLQLTKVPFPYKNLDHMKSALSKPIGRDFNNEEKFKQNIKPRVVVNRIGQTIQPINESALLNAGQKRKTDMKLEEEKNQQPQKKRARRKR